MDGTTLDLSDDDFYKLTRFFEPLLDRYPALPQQVENSEEARADFALQVFSAKHGLPEDVKSADYTTEQVDGFYADFMETYRATIGRFTPPAARPKTFLDRIAHAWDMYYTKRAEMIARQEIAARIRISHFPPVDGRYAGVLVYRTGAYNAQEQAEAHGYIAALKVVDVTLGKEDMTLVLCIGKQSPF